MVSAFVSGVCSMNLLFSMEKTLPQEDETQPQAERISSLRAIPLPLHALARSSSPASSPVRRASFSGQPPAQLSPKAPYSPRSPAPGSPKGGSARQGDAEAQLLVACRDDSIEKALPALRKNPNLEVTDPQGYTPLFLGAKNKNLALCALLLSKGARADVATVDGNTPLLEAAKGNNALAMLLLEHNAAIDANGPGNFTPLLNALTAGNAELAFILIRRKADVNARSIGGHTPLLVALAQGYDQKNNLEEVIHALIAAGADITAKDDDRWTPLLMATRNRHTAIALQLVEIKAGIDDANCEGMTPLLLATFTDNTELVMSLLKAGAKARIAVDLPKNYYEEKLSSHKAQEPSLIKAAQERFHLYSKNFVWTPFLMAVYNGNLKIAEALIDHDPDCLSDILFNRMNPLHLAVCAKSRDLVRMLCQRYAESSASLNALDNDGMTPLSLAFKYCCDSATVVIKKEKGISPQGKDEPAQAEIIVDQDFLAVIYVFLSFNGIDVNKGDKRNLTPLHLAVEIQNPDLIRSLMKRNADPTIAADHGLSPIGLARGNSEIMKILQKSSTIKLDKVK